MRPDDIAFQGAAPLQSPPGQGVERGPNHTDMEKEALHLWFAYPNDVLADRTAHACELLLSEDERARWQAFKFDRLRREYLTTRALVRTALSHYHPIPPHAWRFTLNAYGKPATDPECGLRFNLSNSPGLVVCLIGQEGELGVDVEPRERVREIAEVAATAFSPLELAQLEALPSSEQLDRGLSLWTLKEAYIKARGMGLSLPLNKFYFLFGGAEGIRLELDPCLNDEPGRWRFCLLERAGHRVALMAESAADPELEMWEARPLLAAPTQLPTGGEEWFPHSQAVGFQGVSEHVLAGDKHPLRR
jgi:4'-phosphopantetheinyl transferase